jgi:hypothetical protein
VQQITKQRSDVSPFYSTISKSPIFEWCEVMANAEKNPLYKTLVQFLGNTVPEVMHKCPYWVRLLRFIKIEK